ncbi:kinase-like protein [Trametopsis cervina]|nr:kinase-like protein [Trametopsis cervina]
MIDNWHHAPHSYGFAMGPSSSYSSSSSTRSSHLSILTSPSSVSSALSRTSSSSENADQPPLSPTTSAENSRSSASKTDAFFASPFSALSSLPPEPLHPVTVDNNTSPTSPSDADVDNTPRMNPAPAPVTKKSLNDSFFSTAWPTAPLPSVPSEPTQSHRAPPSAPAITSSMPPLSRFFPSRMRYTSVDELPSREGSPRGYHPPPQPSPPRASAGRRQLVELDPDVYQQTQDPRDQQDAVPLPRPVALNVLIPSEPQAAAGSSKLPTPATVPPSRMPQLVESPTSMVETAALRPGDAIIEPNGDDEGGEAQLHLVLMKVLGKGAFSSVWLARDETGHVGKLEITRKDSLKKQKSKRSLRRKGTGHLSRRAVRTSEGSDDGYGSERAVEGTIPQIKAVNEAQSDGRLDADGVTVRKMVRNVGRLVALKMTDKSLCDRDDRTRVSFVREVEVLKHISHPSIVSYIHAFSTPAYHVLVLEHISGGELFDLVSSQETHTRLYEPLLRRIFGELVRAVGWMHAVGLVHRDIKLENILLTRDAFADPTSPAPLIKLTDFGLSRFIDPSTPLLTTRCGSESYAAPELVTGRPYDGRETDAWACGIVLYALVTRRLPFDAMNPPGESSGRTDDATASDGRKVRGPRKDERLERRALLMRIAKGEYTWPAPEEPESNSLRGLGLAKSEGVRRMVGRLLVRDPSKRAKVAQLWDDPWLAEEGAPPPPILPDDVIPYGAPAVAPDGAWDPPPDDSDTWVDDDGEFGEDDDDNDDGVLVDEHDIAGSVASQELMP